MPEGRLALLFTDIEGSTALLHELGDAYGELLDAHDVLLRGIWQEYGAVEVDNEGDSFFVVFTDHEVAAAAASAIVRRCAEQSWPGGVQLRIRQALHSGEPRVRGRHYWGVDVHYAARLCSAAQGGQVLLSAAMRAQLPTYDVDSLGAHGVKDFAAPRELFHLVVDGRHADDFGPPRTISVMRSNIPSITTPIIGRDEEISRICGHLLTGGDRIITLVGSGGMGKTRTVIACAERLAPALRDGVAFVALASADDVDAALRLVSDAVGAPISDSSHPLDALVAHLQDRRVLLVLDNTEHLPRLGPVVSELTQRLESLLVLVASQAPLGIRDEAIERLTSLPVPGESAGSAAEVGSNPAVSLLIDRIQSHEPGFTLTAANAEPLAQLSRQLEGVPLALELAAARVPALGVERLLKLLQRDPDVLGEGPADLPARQRGLRAALDWTVSLLEPRDKTIFAGLGAFASAWSLEAAEQLFEGDLGPAATWEGLTRLRDLSLVVTRGDGRFTMAERVRRHAEEQLTLSGLEHVRRRRHADIMLDRLDWLGQQLMLDWVPAIADLVDEAEEILHALNWARGNDPAALRELVAAAAMPLNQVGRLPALFEDVEVLSEDPGEDRTAGLLLLARALVVGMGGEDSAEAVRLARRALPLLRAHGTAMDQLRAILAMHNHFISMDELAEVPELVSEARRLTAQMDDPRWVFAAEKMELAFEIASNDLEAAERHLEAIAAMPALPEHVAIDHATMRGDLAFQRGDYELAVQHYAECARRMGSQDLENLLYQVQGIAVSLAALGWDAEATELLLGAQIIFGARTGRSLELIMPVYGPPLEALRARFVGPEAQEAVARAAALRYEALIARALDLAEEVTRASAEPGRRA